MNNVKVSFKILLLVLIALVGMAVIGFRGWSGLSKAGADMSNMYEKNLRAIALIGDEIEAMRVIQVRTYQAIADPVRAAEVKKGAVKGALLLFIAYRNYQENNVSYRPSYTPARYLYSHY